jgi:hypothetical protein
MEHHMKRSFSLLLATFTLVGCQNLGMTGPDGDFGGDFGGINADLVPGDQLVITGFDAARGGIFAIADGGSAVSEARMALELDPPDGIGLGDGVSYVPFNTLDLSQPGVATANIMVLYVALNAVDPISALSMPEQTALLNYVLGGGCAVLIADNDHAANPAWVAANSSLVGPFGMTVESMFTGLVDAQIVNHTTALTDIPGRIVDHMAQNSPGLITDLGPNGIAIAAVTGAVGDAMALIQAGDLGVGSGPVIVFSDVNSFLDAAPFPGFGHFGENKNLWLNTMDYCFDNAPPPPPPNSPPTADAGGPYSALEAASVTFDGSNSSDPEDANAALSFDWDFGDSNTGTGETTSHTYAAAGTYIVTLTVTDTQGLSSTSATTATITARTVEDAINDLTAQVNDLVTAGSLDSKDAAKLVRRLEAALKVDARDGRNVVRDVIRKLEQFIDEVQRLVNRNKLSAEDGQALIDAAQATIDQLAP